MNASTENFRLTAADQNGVQACSSRLNLSTRHLEKNEKASARDYCEVSGGALFEKIKLEESLLNLVSHVIVFIDVSGENHFLILIQLVSGDGVKLSQKFFREIKTMITARLARQ